jgi:hypothetical protein
MQDLFNMSEDTGMDFLEKKTTTNDGIYRPSPKNAKDKKKGYSAVIRFLPNFSQDGKLGPNAIEKMIHYVKLPNYPELGGYYDSMRNFNETCDLTNTYWELKNSPSAVEQEKAELISRTTKYYSYVMIVEDENQPELEGKIMIFPFGYKIKDKIMQEKTGEITGVPCNVYDLANGKEFRLIVKDIGGYQNYDSSQFKPESTAIKLRDKNGDLKTVPTEEKDGKKVITNPKIQEAIKNFLLSRELNLDDHQARRWTDEQQSNVQKIISVLKGNPIVKANTSIENAKKNSQVDTTSFEENEEVFSESNDIDDDFFDV